MSATRSRGERGAAAVEFALIALLFFTLLVSVIEGGRLFMMQAQLASAAREGARELAIHNKAGDAVAKADAAFSFGTPAASVTPCPVSSAVNSDAKVVLTYKPGMLTGFIPVNITLKGEGVMRCGG